MATNYHECNSIFFERACDLFGEMKQQQIADMTGLAQGKVSDILSQGKFGSNPNKKPSAETVYKIAKAFNVSTDYLLGLTDYKTDSKATRELCSTLGLSEEAVKILSADDTSIIAKQWKELIANEPCDNIEDDEDTADQTLELLFDEISANVGFVINRLIEEMIYTQSYNMEHDDGNYFIAEKSLVDCLADFFDCSDTEGFRAHIDGQDVFLPAKAILSARTKDGRPHLRPKSVKELIIDATIDKITARLRDIEERELSKKTK